MRLRDLDGARVVVWGAGVEGRAAAEVIRSHTFPASLAIVVDESRPTDPPSINGVPLVQSTTPPGVGVVAMATIVVKSPGVPPYHGPLARAVATNPKLQVTGGSALWFDEAAAATGSPLNRTIAVTGSKGKSTTSSLIAHLLGALTKDVLLAGNVGRAPLNVLADGLRSGDPFPADRWHVFELSSFQAAEVTHSPAVVVLTSLFPEHLDWHDGVDRYYSDKLNLMAHGAMVSVINVDNPTVADFAKSGAIGGSSLVAFGDSNGLHVSPSGDVVDGASDQIMVRRSDIPLVGRHNAMNLCGALAAIRAAGFDLTEHRDRLIRALKTFVPLEHRLQAVGDVGGRSVIDDSLSTAPQAAVAALAAYADRPVGIIIGGHDRGLDYASLAEALAERATPTWVAAVPESGLRIGELVKQVCASAGNGLVSVQQFDEFDAAVQYLGEVVPVGGAIVLSPAAPSFGRFRDYKERGLHFRNLLGL
jgi:UDP-N-acetylmuramoyl-L-alanine---L-glutamate ligase